MAQDRPVEVVDALRALGGTARRQELTGHVGWRALKRAATSDEIVRDGDAWSLVGTDRDRVLARQLRGVRSHLTAAAHWGLALPPTGAALHDVTIGRKAQRKDVPDDVALHYRDYRDDDLDGDVTTVLTTVVDCLRDESLQVALCAGDSALRDGLVTRERLVTRAATLRGPGSRVVRRRVDLLDGKAANAFESSCRALLVGAGLLGFRPQVSVRHPTQWIGFVDLADEALRIIIECDGFETHGTRGAFVSDRVRLTWLVSAGWRPLQFTWEQVMFRQDWVLERILDTVAVATGAAIAAQPPREGATRAA